MSAYINEITVMGNLGKDPELFFFANGTPSLRISIATPDQWTDKETGEIKESTQWHTALLVGNQAEIVAKYMKKGDKIWARGPLQTRIYKDDRTGMDRLSVVVKVQDMKMIHTKVRHDENREGQAASAEQQAKTAQPPANPLEQFS
ncbi:single-strand DNA-binding protein [Advenella incenata]|uniref:Single-stranded DNA-binding protein n=1 Tax=Advenella incenata TaxID=267800 RepID=A0A4Q7V6Z3_9BURK|nr:single-stranded DNA-binding protein [Advenella incenata]RZT91063.1 single-strand DNA-binding protein [Advenella incenata]